MFVRSYKRKKNGKWHEYFSVVENRRVAEGTTVQRTVLYLGEITTTQQDTWRKTLEVFDEDTGKQEQKLLFAYRQPMAVSLRCAGIASRNLNTGYYSPSSNLICPNNHRRRYTADS